jgi:hypothetical protein
MTYWTWDQWNHSLVGSRLLIPGYKASCTDVMDSAFRSCNLGSVSEEIDHLVMGRGVRCTLVLIPGPLNLRPPAGLRSSNFVNGPGISRPFLKNKKSYKPQAPSHKQLRHFVARQYIP